MAKRRKQQGEIRVTTDHTLKHNEFGRWEATINNSININVIYGDNKDHLLSIIKRHTKENVQTVSLKLIKKYLKA